MHWVFRIIGWTVLAAVAVLALLGARAPWSPSGWFTLGILAVGALALLIRDQRPQRGLGLVAGVLFVVLGVVRLVGAGEGMIAMRTLPGGGAARWLARCLDEQDVAQAGARVLALAAPLPASERERLVPAMHAAYVDMRRDDVITPSPVLDTFLGQQLPGGFDTLVIEPRAEPKPGVPMKYGVLFLHGFAGSYTLECWLLARAAREIGALTVCPSTDLSGIWRGERGGQIVRATLDYLHGRGITRVFLAGLSNGAMGASAIVAHSASAFVGLILISGAPASGGSGDLPTLVLHGTQDNMTLVKSARAFVERNHADLHELDGGHFVLLTHRAEARQIIVDWLMRQTGYHVN
jgi:hypothetical protein